MDIDSMIAVLEAAKNGEKIETANVCGEWTEVTFSNFPNYRIAPKKEMTLVEQLRSLKPFGYQSQTCCDAADRIEELERKWTEKNPSRLLTTDELLAELKRRVK